MNKRQRRRRCKAVSYSIFHPNKILRNWIRLTPAATSARVVAEPKRGKSQKISTKWKRFQNTHLRVAVCVPQREKAVVVLYGFFLVFFALLISAPARGRSPGLRGPKNTTSSGFTRSPDCQTFSWFVFHTLRAPSQRSTKDFPPSRWSPWPWSISGTVSQDLWAGYRSPASCWNVS